MKQPPRKSAPATSENIHALEAWLDSITAFGVNTDGRPWVFYEELDAYLGPWGTSEYLIAYGKKYCRLFYEDRALMHSPAGRRWVIRTLQLLQNVIKDFVLERFRKGTLASLTPGQLKDVAFKSHAAAYTEGGLLMVCILSPLLIIQVVQIPGSEFLPWKPDAERSWSQAFETARIVGPQALDMLSSALSVDGHSSIFAGSYHLDTMAHQHMYELNDALRGVRRLLESGLLDHAGNLERLEERLEGARWPNHEMAEAARDLLVDIRSRQHRVSIRYEREIRRDQSLNAIYKAFDPRAF